MKPALPDFPKDEPTEPRPVVLPQWLYDAALRYDEAWTKAHFKPSLPIPGSPK